MATFTLRINIDNDAFHPHPSPELARLLQDVAKRVARDEGFHDPRYIMGQLYDVNGNRIGTYQVEDAE